MQRFKDISEEELAELIALQQKRGRKPGERKLNNEELAQGLKMFNAKPEKQYSNKFVADLVKVLSTIGQTLCWPILLFKFLRELRLYKQYGATIRYAIDNNEEVYDFMERFHFYPAWFTRLYSQQDIPEEFVGVSDEVLEGLTIQSIMPIRPMLAKANLLSILTLRIERISITSYLVILEPENFRKIWNIFWWMFGAILGNLVLYTMVILICTGVL